MSTYSTLDEIDSWLYRNFYVNPGATSFAEQLRHRTAREIAEALWPRPLTPADIRNIIYLYREEWNKPPTDDGEDIFERVLKRFNEILNKQ